jgi:hypothetical protein
VRVVACCYALLPQRRLCWDLKHGHHLTTSSSSSSSSSSSRSGSYAIIFHQSGPARRFERCEAFVRYVNTVDEQIDSYRQSVIGFGFGGMAY